MKVGVLHLLVLVAHDVSCCFMLISYLCFCVVLVYFDACWVCLGGIAKCFLECFHSYFACFWKGFCGLFWHYSPLDREEVAMYGGRALVGPQW